MPKSRSVLPKKIYMLTRRTTRRFFLLRPDADGRMQNLFTYCLGVAAKKHGVRVHGLTLMSTHYHLIVEDVRGVLPDFTKDLNQWLAMGVKCLRGWDEEVFNKSQTSRVELVTEKAIVEKTAYVIANCVEAGIVDRVGRYPGLVTRAADIGSRVYRGYRPEGSWFVSAELWPDQVELEVGMSDRLLEAHGLEAAQEEIREAVRERVIGLRAERRVEGLGYMGAKACLRAPIETRATKREALVSRNPTHAVGSGNREAAREKAKEEREWSRSYDGCFERWRSGDRDVVFPAGTWLMRKLHGAKVAEYAPPPCG